MEGTFILQYLTNSMTTFSTKEIVDQSFKIDYTSTALSISLITWATVEQNSSPKRPFVRSSRLVIPQCCVDILDYLRNWLTCKKFIVSSSRSPNPWIKPTNNHLTRLPNTHIRATNLQRVQQFRICCLPLGKNTSKLVLALHVSADCHVLVVMWRILNVSTFSLILIPLNYQWSCIPLW